VITVIAVYRELAEARRRELETVATVDALTGVLNRRGFDRALTEAWQSGLARCQSLGLLVIDIDYFKRFNDRYGHQVGDDCLRAVAQACAKAVRDGGIFARYGGEEFAVIVARATKTDLEMIAERIRASVRELSIPRISNAERLTLSIGAAATVPNDTQSHTALFALADASLYQAKALGRGCFVAWED
jgi:diguanylate cyclase (GGDEF)-like protein